MPRTITIGVALAVLIAVATVLIAPTIDLPETTLREHQVVSHSSGEHAPGNLSMFSGLGLSALFAFMIAARLSPELSLWHRPRVPSSQVLRC
jgi:hypothetical protein